MAEHVFMKETVARDKEQWPKYRKATETRAKRVEGKFSCLTQEGFVSCEDGYVAVDSQGYPYPISKEEFETIYEPVNNED